MTLFLMFYITEYTVDALTRFISTIQTDFFF